MVTEERYLGDGVLVGEDVEEEQRGGLSLAICDWTVTVHHQVLFDPRRQVLLPARLHDKHRKTSERDGGRNPIASTSEPVRV